MKPLTPIYEPLDKGIADLVKLLRDNGVDTFTSCEGGHHITSCGFELPTIRINPTDKNNMDADRNKIAAILSKARYAGYNIKYCYPYNGEAIPWDIQQHGIFIEIEFWAIGTAVPDDGEA